MKKWVKISLIVVAAILVILAIIFAYIWLNIISPGLELKGTMEQIDRDQMESDMASVMNGDCSKLASLEEQTNVIVSQLKKACENPVLKKQIEKEQPGACADVNNPNSNIYLALNQLKEACP